MIKKTPKKNNIKKIKKTHNPKFKFFALSNIIVIITILALMTTTYFYIKSENLQEQNIKQQNQIKEIKKNTKVYEDKRAKYFEEKTNALDIEYSTQIESNTYVNKQENKKKFNYDEIIKPDTKKTVQNNIKDETKPLISDKPKLAIIIDDVTTSSQINKIQNIGYSVNMSFLPPTPRHRNSAKIANSLEHYMIHLPLQATSNKYDEKNTLYITSKYDTIEKRIINLKKLYPKAKFINNHTGSKFTANQEAMDKLFKVLKKYDYTFIDSKTTSKSVAKISSKKYGVRLLARNIFLDNKKDKKYITKQLQKSIKIAKKYGSAIAIGHPYNITFETLKESSKLLKDIELVYVHQL
ncbi:MAG: divergent polysaccharide deacetylase family protein [Campylobacterota bacterium]|nr:divergent polysaccharide deacetylase family protein [Campylobacterota bacterium]